MKYLIRLKLIDKIKRFGYVFRKLKERLMGNLILPDPIVNPDEKVKCWNN